jgi:hypothetical protein
MARRREETPFDKIMVVASRLRLYTQYGDHALGDQTPQQFAGDVLEAFEHLMVFRNIVNGMASFEQRPEEAAASYISHDVLKRAVEGIE